MKLRTVGIAGSVLLAVCGLSMMMLADHVKSDVKSNFSVDSLEPRHLVTQAMSKKTAEWTRRRAPRFSAKDYAGDTVDIAQPGARKPQFVYFVVDGCPCSVDAEPLFQSLWKHHNREIDFIAITDGDARKAQAWSAQMLMPYPIVPDPKLGIVRAFGATNSVFSALIDKDGRIVHMWPGYSKDILADMNQEMASLLGHPIRPFDARYAPVKRATGCAFKL